MTRLFAGIEPLDLPARFANARTRIILHAAVYGPFATSAPHRDGLAAALARPSFERLDIIAVSDSQPWSAPFMRALRLGESEQAHAETLRTSHDYLRELDDNGRGKVRIHRQTSIPSLPVIVIDDTLVFGQYAHCETYAADGFWGVLETDVDKLFLWTKTGGPPDHASAEDVAAYRIVHECHHAMTGDDDAG